MRSIHPKPAIRWPRWLLICACFCAFSACRAQSSPAADATAAVSAAMRDAMSQRDAAAIDAAVARANAILGERAGVPDVADRYRPIPHHAPPLTREEAAAAIGPTLAELRKRRWWRVGLDPTRMGRPLREPAEAVLGALAMREVSPPHADTALALAVEAGDFLLWAQAEAGSGVFPFPASLGVSDAAPFRASQRFLERAEREGLRDRVVRRGWLIDDLGDGGLQFDNGECGIAMLALYRATGQARYLEAARRAADWARAQPLSINWNYNSFSVYLLADTYRATGDARYRDAALEKARFGVMPGQLREGRYAGRWHDPHNARPAYHFIMLRSLVALAAVLPPNGEERRSVQDALRQGLIARNADVFGPGASNLDKAVEALQLLETAARDDPDMAGIFTDTRSDDALAALRKLAAQSVREGRAPLAPRAYGLLLAHAVGPAQALR